MKAERKKIIILIVFIVYILIVLKLTIFRPDTFYAERQLSLAFFTNLINIYETNGPGEFLRLFLGNIGWFIPYGFLLPLLLKKPSLPLIVTTALTFSFIIESTQFLSHKGVAELDDLILNTLGATLGYFLYALSQKIISQLKP